MNRRILALAVVVMMFPALSMAESVYKWTDENGVTHFGDRKPTGKKSESVSIRTGKKTSSPRQSAQEQVEQLEENQASAEEDAQVKKVEEARRKQRAANCRTAQTNLSLLQTGSRVKVQENGEERYLSQEEIQQKRDEFEKVAEENCGEPTPEE